MPFKAYIVFIATNNKKHFNSQWLSPSYKPQRLKMSCKRLSLSNKAYISNTAIFLHGKSYNVWSSISTSLSSSSSSSLHQNWLVPSFSVELLSMPGFRRTWGALCSLVCDASFVGSSSGDNNIEPCTKVSQTRNFQLRSPLQLLCLILCDLHLAILKEVKTQTIKIY